MDLIKKDNELLKYKYGVDEDPNFSPDKNKEVIERTIAKAEKEKNEKSKVWNENISERAEAIASFLKHVESGKNNSVIDYFGRRKLAELRGEDIITQLKGSVSKNAKA